ncbi:MAG: zinc ribbon domain-containing protein [Oscillospiraceae bacterium]|nr:zinc ribbon domain-containing protein [Oscillospiraceae bacterium]
MSGLLTCGECGRKYRRVSRPSRRGFVIQEKVSITLVP